jgi:hypothetical protein
MPRRSSYGASIGVEEGTSMTFKKSVSLILIGSQLSLAQAAFASPAQALARSPEFNLVESVIALQGAKLSANDEQNQITQAMTEYLVAAPTTGQQARLQQALIDLGVYTPAQAASFTADAQAVETKVAASNPSSADEASQTMSAEIAELSNLHPVGAQFAGQCELGWGMTSAGPVAALVGLCLRFDNPTCTTQETTGVDTLGQVVTIEGPTTCTQANDYPHAAIGDQLMIYGGVASGVGLLLMYLSDGCM